MRPRRPPIPAQQQVPPPEQWVHGTRLGRAHRSVRVHLAEDHATEPGWLECADDAAVHGKHDGIHHRVWAYAEDLPHPARGSDREAQ